MLLHENGRAQWDEGVVFVHWAYLWVVCGGTDATFDLRSLAHDLPQMAEVWLPRQDLVDLVDLPRRRHACSSSPFFAKQAQVERLIDQSCFAMLEP